MVNERLVYVLETEGFLSSYQAGFRKFHSTIDQLSHLDIYVQDAFKRREHTLAVFFDLERAYDTMWRYNILEKCYAWGLRGNLPKFLQSFLQERRFRVRVGSSLSEAHLQENGTPQGSVLSVTCFNIAINNIADQVGDPITKSLYVDDLALFLSGKNIENIARDLQIAIDNISNEAERSGFKFSSEKTGCMHFCRLRKEHVAPTLYLKGRPLRYKENLRFLGLILDRKLTWQDHIHQTAINGKKSLKVLKFLSSYRWNIDRSMLLRIFMTITRSRMEYGMPIFSCARKTRLQVLDRVYNQGIRLATGAFRTSPLNSLYVEAGLMSPQLRREQLTLTFAAGLWGKHNHFLFKQFFEGIDEEFYRGNKTCTRSLNVRTMEIMEGEEMHFGPVEGWRFAPIPPWTTPRVKTLTDLANFKKEENPPYVFRNKLNEIMEKYANYEFIYTDGSKVTEGVGSAVYVGGVTHTWTLPQCASIYTAELYAIYQAITLCTNREACGFAICTDSLSATMALKDMFSTDPMIQNIYKQVMMVHQRDKEIIFVWVPGHIGILGNELADVGAKRAAAAPPPDYEIPIRPADLKAYCKLSIREKWQRCWNESTDKLRQVKPMVKSGCVETMDRRERVVLTRLRIGHTRLTHLYLLVGARPPRCPHCNVPLTVLHLLDGCSVLQAHKTAVGLTGDLPNILKEGRNMDKLFQYLRDINMYFKL